MSLIDMKANLKKDNTLVNRKYSAVRQVLLSGWEFEKQKFKICTKVK